MADKAGEAASSPALVPSWIRIVLTEQFGYHRPTTKWHVIQSQTEYDCVTKCSRLIETSQAQIKTQHPNSSMICSNCIDHIKTEYPDDPPF